ncbi:MAG: hypothetical protein KKD73_09565 [Proteobacteria bacterium]|nr:hypothetical protein [Pseudomonadota bacterium]MBU1641555.1 hypothetical protein [Pseudomonadota bacterium]
MGEDVSRQELLAEELFMLTAGGEMPEVAFHSAVYYLTKDKDGPALELGEEDIALLKGAVVQRYTAIVLRDLCPENKHTSIFRGLKRSAANWQRLVAYAARENIDLAAIQIHVAQALLNFLQHEYDAVICRGEVGCVNCSQERLVDYANTLGVVLDREIEQWRKLF